MNQAIKKKWLAKLKTSKKARKMLNNPRTGGYCCLGVLCTIYTEETKKGRWTRSGEFVTISEFNSNEIYNTELLPLGVLKWSGLQYSDQGPLAVLNDNQAGFPIEAIERL